jgi:hypothetical protein
VETELTVRGPDLRVTVEIDRGGQDVLWAVTRAAFEAARSLLSTPEDNNHHHPTGDDDDHCRRPIESKAERIRRVARRVLADGRIHERREISKAVREAGLDPHTLNKVLEAAGDFERVVNGNERPAYRDTSVPSAYKQPETTPDDEKPAWMRNPVAASNGGTDG